MIILVISTIGRMSIVLNGAGYKKLKEEI